MAAALGSARIHDLLRVRIHARSAPTRRRRLHAAGTAALRHQLPSGDRQYLSSVALASASRGSSSVRQRLSAASAGASSGRTEIGDAGEEIAPSSLDRCKAGSSAPWSALRLAATCALVAALAGIVVPGGIAHAAAANSIGASKLGLRVAEYLRGFGLPDEAVVVAVAALPVLELRGAIPIGHWLRMDPLKAYVLSVLGNMAPIPFIVLYLERLSKAVGERSAAGRRLLYWIFERTRRRAGPIEEFEWLGLMLFVAVPLPGTGAWTGAIAASILGMPFWDAITANFVGVLVAGLLVNLFVSLGARAACLVGLAILAASFFMWTALRALQHKGRT